MIDIKTLEPRDEGRWVIYRDKLAQQDSELGKTEKGRLKSYKDGSIFIVFKCNNLWVDYLNYTGNLCSPANLYWKHPDGDDKQVMTIFRKFKDTKDIIALFPEIPASNKFDECSSYMHNGQHSAAHINTVLDETNPVPTYYGYRDLMAELIGIGYNVNVIETLLTVHNKTRRSMITNGK